jgi:hypothetical protein
MAFVALGQARTEEAKQALLGVMNNVSLAAVDRVRAMYGLVDRDDVDVSLAQTLAGYSNRGQQIEGDAQVSFFNRHAVLGLGMLAGRQENSEITQVASQTVQGLIHTDTDAALVRPALGALANIGEAGNLGMAKGASRSEDVRMRAAAAIVMRRMHPKDTAAFVAEWAARETSAKVRHELWSTVNLQSRDLEERVGDEVALQAIAELRRQPPPLTRKALLELLGREAKHFAPARAALLEQIPLEVARPRGGLYDVIAGFLEPRELNEVLSAL